MNLERVSAQKGCNSDGYHSYRGAPGSVPGQFMGDFWWTEWQGGRVSPSNAVSPAIFHSTKCSVSSICYLGLT
jgi:hypothetical protein